MRRAWRLALAAGGLAAGTVRADEPGWQPAAAPPVRVELPPVPAATPAPALPPPPGGTVWVKSAGGSGPVWGPAVQPPTVEDPPRPPTKPLPVPKPLPPVEPAPQPKPVEPQKLPARPPVETPKPLPMPRREPEPARPQPKPPAPPPAAAAAPAPPPAVPAPVCELEPHPTLVPAAATLPVRRGVVGSPNLSLSRDRSALDLFGADLFAPDADTQVVGEEVPADRFALSAEYLLWWVRPSFVPVLATTATGQTSGFLGEPGTQTLLGPGGFGSTSRSGFRVRAGAWLEDAPVGGVGGSFFFLGERTTTAEVASDRFPTIARPIFAANLNREFSELVAYPGLATGRLVAEADSFLWGADVYARGCLFRTCGGRAELFAGYRHLNLREGLSVTEFITAGGPLSPDPAGTAIVVNDTFRTRNRFHGGQIGWAGSRRAGRLDLSARASVALGGTSQRLDVSGTQARTRPGAVTEEFTGGLLAAGPNLGRFERTRFSVVPEATLDVGVWLTPGVKLSVGYNFLFWTNVLRPGDQIDRVVDLSFVPNAPAVGFVANRPLPTFRQTDVWAQGVQFGVETRW